MLENNVSSYKPEDFYPGEEVSLLQDGEVKFTGWIQSICHRSGNSSVEIEDVDGDYRIRSLFELCKANQIVKL